MLCLHLHNLMIGHELCCMLSTLNNIEVKKEEELLMTTHVLFFISLI